MIIGGKAFDTHHHTYVMGILNITPDSFSDGGYYMGLDQARRQVEKMICEGADLIDIGGESTRPGYKRITDEEEIARILPVIEMLKKEYAIPVSVDTYKSKVAEAASEAGADMINDIWGLRADPDMAGVVARHEMALCLMHNKTQPVYEDLIPDCLRDLSGSIDIALKAGIDPDRIILDPGVGFAKNREENLKILRELARFREPGYPVLLGASRKSVIGLTLQLPADQRLEGTLVTTVLAVMSGCTFVRVHDVKENVRAIKMAEAIRYI